MNSNDKIPNKLIHESSPYLLQHAYNPVDWNAYSSEIIQQAIGQNKPIIVSIGYSACHWCHVMEHETFENLEAAKLMNDEFICIKIDREERPDLDHYYLAAAHLINGNGGWPLNCITLPNGKPFFAGTYFRTNQWINLLKQIADLWKNDEAKVNKYANEIELGIKNQETIKMDSSMDFDPEIIHLMVNNWQRNFDLELGGNNRAPKFPLPNNYEFLLNYGHIYKNNVIINHCHNTLTKMACGGIYDQIGGGFARYSVDEHWKVPHFEKMLYDNAQLIKLYSLAFSQSKNPLYKQVVIESIEFLNRELKSAEGAYFSALDADSEGVEGKFYVWTLDEIKEALQEDANLAIDYFKMNAEGLWEDENYILLAVESNKTFCEKYNLSSIDFDNKIKSIKNKLLAQRAKRIRPGLDTKILCSWNAMTSTALFQAYKVFDEDDFLHLAIQNLEFILQNFVHENGDIFHTYSAKKVKINGFLEDYVFVIEALLEGFICTANEEYLLKSVWLSQEVFKRFEAENKSSFYFSQKNKNDVSVSKIEFYDNVIPSSNSVMANNLLKIASLDGNTDYSNYASKMLNSIQDQMAGYGSGFSNWALAALKINEPFFELVVSGSESKIEVKKLWKEYHPNSLITFYDKTKTNLDFFKGKENDSAKSMYFKCVNGSCTEPVDSVDKLNLNS